MVYLLAQSICISPDLVRAACLVTFAWPDMLLYRHGEQCRRELARYGEPHEIGKEPSWESISTR